MLSLDRLIDHALAEDIHTGDITTKAVVPNLRPFARLVAKEDLVLAGIYVAARVFQRINPATSFTACFQDGQRVCKGEVIAIMQGNASAGGWSVCRFPCGWR